MSGTPPKLDPYEALRQELARLREKRAQMTDADVISALDMRIAQIEKSLPETKAKPSEVSAEAIPEAKVDEPSVPEAEVPPATPEQIREADNLIRQAKVEKMRGNAKASSELIQKASQVAPGSPAVLEAFGDDLADRKRLADAKVVYQRALKLDPKNVGIETKLAHIALKVSMAGSIEDQLRRNLSDSPFIDGDDRTASLPAAIVLSALFPGAGHLVLGQTTRGFSIMGAYLVALICLFGLFGSDLEKLVRMGAGVSAQPNYGVFLPLSVMGLIYLGTLFSLKGMSDKVNRSMPTERPRPPVDLPFE